jgi:hypothetical protein
MESTLKGNCLLKENWRNDMIDGKMDGNEKINLGRIEMMTINNFNKQKNNLGGASSLLLPLPIGTADGGDSVYSAGIKFNDEI